MSPKSGTTSSCCGKKNYYGYMSIHLIDVKMWNFPIFCAVLALDSWNYCSGEEGPTAHYSKDCLIFFIQLNHFYKTKIKQRRCHPPYDNSLCHKVAHVLFFIETMWGKHWEEDAGLSGLAMQSNSSNCLVLISHRQLGNYLVGTGKSYGPTFPRLYISQCLTLTKKATTHWDPEQYAA